MQRPEDKTKNVVDLAERRKTTHIKGKFKFGAGLSAGQKKKQRKENAVFRKILAFIQLGLILGALAWLSRSCAH